MQTTPLLATLLSVTLALAACGRDDAPAGPPPATTASTTTARVTDLVDRALDHARAEIRTRNITLDARHGPGAPPDAEITPAGDFLVAGKAVPVDAGQRALLLDYRHQIEDIATAGMAIGKEGAALGIGAAADALTGAFSGRSEEEIRQKVEGRTAGIKESAATLCTRLPALRATQQKLASTLPAFKPYATMTERDVADCKAHVSTR